MKLIVPMAGRGKRMRPHSLTTPKPLFPVVNKPIVQKLMEDICRIVPQQLEEIAFVIGDFGAEVERDLIAVAERLGAKGTIHYQTEALGTAHAIYCADSALDGEVIVAFADTLFAGDFALDSTKDGVIWVKKVEDPRPYGVVQMDASGHIVNLVEKPDTFVSDLAIIGIYYLRDGAALKREIEYLLNHDIKCKGEYQLTDALARLKDGGAKLVPGEVDQWMDCGNKEAVLDTNHRQLVLIGENQIAASAQIRDSVILPPCVIGEGAIIEHSVVGPFVSVGNTAKVTRSVITESIIRENAQVADARLDNTILGQAAEACPAPQVLNLGDYSVVS